MEKPSVLLLHGALGSKQSLELIAKELSINFYVHLFNFYGHGGNLDKKVWDMNSLALQIKEYIDFHQLKDYSIFGYSMGGYAALVSTVRYGITPNKIITLGTKFNWTEEATESEIKQLQPELLSVKAPEFIQTLSRIHHPLSGIEILKATQHMMKILSKEQFLTDDELFNIRCLVILLLGDNDKMVSQNETNLIRQKIPIARLMILPETKHPIEKVDPKKLVNVLIGIFD